MNLTNITMDNEELKKLVIKFYDGESTEEEEKYLRAIFSSDQVPEGFETEKEIILFCMANGRIAVPSYNLEEKILEAVDESGKEPLKVKVRKYYLQIISSAAAVLLVLLSTYFLLGSRSGYKDTYSDPVIAYAETMKILQDVSARLNRGTNALRNVSKLSEMTEKSLEKINESSALMNRSVMKLNNIGKVKVLGSISDTGVINK
jgi:hypothetical protein